MPGLFSRLPISSRNPRRTCCFRPLALALALLVSLPSLSFFAGDWFGGTANPHSPFVASAQISIGCPSSRNQIIQTGCQLPILAQFEQSAVQGYLAQHNLPLSDASLVYTYGGTELRNEIRAYMFDLFLSYSGQDLSKLDDVQLTAYSWLQAQVQAEETQYWAAAAKEYNLWNSNKCTYPLDPDVATQQGLQYDPTQWCNPNLANYFSTPPVPTYNYFLAVAWKKTYGSLLGADPNNATILANVQQQATQNAALYALPASFTAAAALGGIVAANTALFFPYADEAVTGGGGSISTAASTSYSAIGSASRSGAQAAVQVVRTTQAVIDDAVEFVTGASTASVVAVAIFAIETAVEAGIDAVNTQQTLDQIATLPGMAAQVAENPPSLATMLTTQDGYTKASTLFVAQTLPDYPQPSADASSAPEASGVFWITQNTTSTATPLLNYLDPSQIKTVAGLRGGWFTYQDPKTKAFQLAGSINYLDWQARPRFATRVGPYQFLVSRPDAQALDDDVPCPASPSTNNLSTGVNVAHCAIYVSNQLQMLGTNGLQMTVEVIDPPTVTSASYASFTTNRYSSFPLTFTPTVNDVPCVASQSGALPSGVYYSPFNDLFSGTPVASSAGTYQETITVQCGGSQGLSSTSSVELIVASGLAFTSPGTVNITYGLPVGFFVTTTGFPVPKLILAGPSPLPAGLTFHDNGNGTAYIFGIQSFLNIVSCPGGSCSYSVIAGNGVQQISQPLNLIFSSDPNPLTFVAPSNGGTVSFPVGVYSTNPIFTKGGIAGIQIALTGLPSWLAFHDNGDGSATISGTPPLNSVGQSSRITAQGVSCCDLTTESFSVAVTPNPAPITFVEDGGSMAFLAGTSGRADLTSDIQAGTGSFTLAGSLPPGLSFTLAPANPSCTGNCPVNGSITGTPPVGSGGDYKVPFKVTTAAGTLTETLDVVVYDKPALTSPNRIIFYVGIPATSTISASGFPLTSIGPFNDGIGYSAGSIFSTTLPLPPFLKLVSGPGGVPNGTATLSSNATTAEIGLYTITLNIQEQAASIPAVTNPVTQLSSTANLEVYVVPPGDVNLDFKTDCNDLAAVKAGFGALRGTPAYNSALDVNGDGIVNVKDLAWVASTLPAGTKCSQ